MAGVALVGLPAVALAAFALTAYVEWAFYPPVAYGKFALHPLLMGVAFLLVAPLGAGAFALRERYGVFGSRARAKLAHASLQLCALVLGCAGARSIWLTHEASSLGPHHCQSLHSWIGVCVLALYAAQWVGGAWVFYGGAAASTRAAFVPLHARCGRLLVTGALLS